MKIKKNKVLIVLGVIVLLVSQIFAQAAPVWRVDSQGNITKDGDFFRVKGGSWFGLEGRHEPSNDANNPSGAPMEMYMGNVFWAESGRTYDQDITEFKNMGINVIRLPLVPQTLDANDAQGKEPYLKNAQSVRIANARLALETVIKKLNTAGIYVLLDIHSCSNYVGWRAGRFDARPPYADNDRDDYDFKRENCSCAANGNPSGVNKIQAYDATKWLANLRTLAGFSSALNVTNIIGIDIFNEPWDFTWADWKSYIDQAYTAINAVNSNILIFAQGISATAGNQDGTPDTITEVPNGNPDLNPNWGENLYEAGNNPPTMPKNRLVFSPHTYGPSVFVQRMFMDPSQSQCTGLEGDEAGDAKCQIVITPSLLEQGWEEHFGYLKAMGYAICIGEFGGNPDWPKGKSSLRDQNRYSYITDNTVDWQWQSAFVNYLLKKNITDSIYWSINPESGDTGGIYGTPYDPRSNTGGWGTWTSPDQKKVELLKKLWNAPTPNINATPTSTPTPTRTPTRTTSTGTSTPTPIITGAVVFTSQTSYTASANANFVTNIDVSVGGKAVASYGLVITYDASAINVVTVEAGTMGLSVTANTQTPGTITVAGFDASGKTGTNLLKITWLVVGTSGTSNIGITVDTLTDSNYNSLGTVGRGASVTIGGGGLKGDANDDGQVTIVDALMIAQYSVGLPVSINMSNSDTNCDGTVNIVDALRLAQYTVGLVSIFC